MKTIDELMAPVKNIGKVFGGNSEAGNGTCTDEPLIFIPKDKSYIEVSGHKITETKSFEDFLDYLQQRNDFENDYNYICRQRSALIDYLKIKLEESKLMATYENGVRYPCMQERIYQDILDRVRVNDYFIKEEK